VATSQRSPRPQPLSHRPPQPSLDPHACVAGQLGVQIQVVVMVSQRSKVVGQGPTQRPPQPSSAPHIAPGGHERVQKHWPTMQRSRGERLHGGSHAQVLTQVPPVQSEPAAQVTPAQGSAEQVPLEQICPAAQITPSHGERGTHWRWQALEPSQRPPHRWMGAQRPRRSSQN